MNRLLKRCWLSLFSMMVWVSSLSAVAGTPTFSLAFSPSTVAPGTVSTMTYTIDNSANNVGVSDLAFTNTLPTGMTIADSPDILNTCINGTFTAVSGGSSITFSDYRLGLGSTCTFRVNVVSSTPGSHVNTTSTLSTSEGSVTAASATLTVDASRPGFSMAFSPATIVPGGVSTLTYTIDNSLNGSKADLLTFTHTLPTNLLVSADPDVSNTCTGGLLPTPVTTAAPGTNSIAMQYGHVAAGSTCSISVNVSTSSAGVYITETGELTQNGANSSGSASGQLNVEPSFLFANFPASASPGSSVTLAFTINNLDRINTASDITFTNDLNATLSGLTATALPADGFCGSGSTLTGSSTITVAGANLAAEASCSFEVTVLVPANAAAGTYTNTTSTVNLTLGSATTKPAYSHSLVVKKAPTITNQFIDDPVSASGDFTQRFVITNTDSANTATSIAFNQIIDDQLAGTVIKTLPASGSCGSGSSFTATNNGTNAFFNVNNANLTAGANCTFDVVMTAQSGVTPGSYTFTTSSPSAVISGSTVYGVAASDSLVVVAAPALQLSINEDSATPDSTVTAEFTLNNSANAVADATGVGFTVDLPSALTGMTATPSSQSDICGSGSSFTDNGSSLFTLSGATLSPGGSCTFSITMQVPAGASPGTVTLTSSGITATTSGMSVSSEAVSDTLVITGLTLSKTFVTNPVFAGDTTILRYTITNAATALAATDIQFSDNLADVISSMTATTLPTTPCGASSAMTGTTNLSFSGGELQPGENCSFDVTLTLPVNASEGSYVSVTSDMSATVNSVNTSTNAASAILDVAELGVVLSSTASSPTSLNPIPISIYFSRSVVNFVVSDLVVGNGSATNFSGSGDTYTVDIVPTADGTVTVDVPANVADDSVNGLVQNTAATQIQREYTATPATITPSLVISSPSVSATTTGPVSYTVTYSDAETVNLSSSAITLNNTGTNATVAVTNGDTSTPTVTLSSITGDGTLGFSIAANSARNGTELAPSAGPATTFVVDNTQPSVVITDALSGAVNSAFEATLTFSEDVTGVAIDDLSVSNASLSGFNAVSATVYKVTVTPSNQGSVTLDVASSAATDAVGNTSTAGQHTVTYDSVSPSLTITGASTPQNAAFTATMTFNEDVTGFDVSDISASNAALSSFNTISASVYTVLVTPSADGAVTLDVAANAAQDTAGNGSGAATQYSVDYDSTVPTVVITGGTADANGVFTATLTFSEAVDNFIISDITAGNGSLDNFVATSSSVYSVEVTPTQEGLVTLNVANGVATDTAGNGNTAASQYSKTFDPVISLTTSANTVSETSGSVTLTAISNVTAGADITVNLVFSGTATSGTDYVAAATSILIPANQSQGTTTLTITSDSVVEGNETLIIDVDTVVGGATNSAAESGTQQQTVTINDDDTVAVTLTASTSSIAEAAGTSTLTVALDKVTFEDVIVSLGYTGTATSGSDYSASASSVTIAAGQTTGTVTLTATSDTTVEVAESIAVDITGVSGGSASENGIQQQTVTIIDDDSVAVTLSASTSSIAENSGTSILTATLNKVTFEDVTVSLGYTGTASNSNDYTTSTSITITAGQTSSSTTLTAISDTLVEADESIVVDITGVNGGAASESGSQQQTITITDDDSAIVTLSASNTTIAETSGTSTLTATLDKATFEDVTVSLGYTGTATNGSDYTASASSITIAAGQTTGTTTLTATSDSSVETNETILVDITGVSGGLASESGTQQQTVTITDDDSAVVTLRVSDSSMAEAAGNSTVTAVLDKATFEDVIVSLGYTGTASSGSDYATPASSITITAGQVSGSTTLTALSDTSIETDETIIIDVTGVAGGSASESGAQQKTVTITDDDSVAVTLAVDANSISETSGVSTLTVTLDSTTFEDVVVSIEYTGTASSGSDYVAPSGSITIPAGQTVGSLTLTAISDTAVEADETITADITGVSGGSAIERSAQQQTVTIIDDDSSVVMLTVSDTSIAEAGGSSTVTATLDKATFEDVVVSLGYTGTATKGSDYVTSAASITIAAGQTIGMATLSVTSDSLVEANETVIVDITSVSGGFASEQDTQQQTITINDDDSASVILLVSNVSIMEASGTSTVSAILNKVTFEDVVVSLGYSGTASGDDFAMSAEAITVTAGQTIGTVTLTAVQDSSEESDESVIIDITAVNGGSVSEEGTQQQTVTIRNDDNETGSDVATVDEGNSIQIDVLANDQGPGGTLNPASVNIYTPASNGATSINTANGFITYTPATDFSGIDTFAYVVNDLQGNTSAPTTVTVTVNNINDAPMAVNDTGTVLEDNPLTLDVLANDEDVDGASDIDSLTLVVTNQPEHGQASVVDGQIIYTPESNYNGSDVFSYQVDDIAGVASNVATVSINVTGSNDAPATQSDSAVTDEDTAVTIAVLDNDTDVDGQLVVNSIAMVALPTNGVAEAQTDGSILYTPNDNFYGTDTFTYTVKDAEDAVSAATEVTVTVQGINDAPVATDDIAVILEDTSFDINVAGNDVDVDDNLDVTSLVVVSMPDNGSVTYNNGMLNYTPAADFGGNDSFSYTISDLDGITSNVATVTITVNEVNDLPLANDDTTTTEEDSAVTIDLLANDQDVDGSLDPASISFDQSENGVVAVDASTGVATYTPNADFNGVDSFQYRINDNEGGESNAATVTIQVSAVNDGPVISGSPVTSVLEGQEYRFVPEITDVDTDSLTITTTNLPDWLTLDSTTGELHGSPDVGDAGSYSDIVLQVSDGEFVAELASFLIEVVGDNDTDGIANHEDTDDDNDGMSDDFELANGFNPFNPADAEEDADNDGLSNLEEALQLSNPLLDDQAPMISTPQPLEFNATGLLTQVSGLEPPTAVDGLDGDVTVNLLGGSTLNLEPGRHQLTWFATDAAGNRSEVQQQLDIHPLISLSSGQIVGEGGSGNIRIFLNGEAPEYPITISYILEGTADEDDHNLTEGSVTLNQDELAIGIPFEIIQDNVIEGTETLDVILTGEGNLDTNLRHTLRIVEENVAPRVEFVMSQNGTRRLIFEQGGGLVDITSTLYDPNPNDQHTVEWVFSGDVSTVVINDLQRQLDPAELSPGLYSIVLRVTDNGSPAITNEVTLSYRVVETLAVLSATQDSDGDGIADIDEGWADDDQDGQPNYLDAISLPNVLNSSDEDGFSFLLEADSDVKLVLGERALSNDGRGAKLATDALSGDMALPEDSFNNLSGYFDFIVNELPDIGQSVNIVIAQEEPIPANAVYRKYDGVWFTFVEDANNSVMSAPGEQGLCPPPQDDSYRAGLNEGDWCVQLTIEDGGPNDADGIQNGSIHDPGGVGVSGSGGTSNPTETNIRSSGGGGGSLDISLLMLLLSLFGLYGVRRNSKFHRF